MNKLPLMFIANRLYQIDKEIDDLESIIYKLKRERHKLSLEIEKMYPKRGIEVEYKSKQLVKKMVSSYDKDIQM